MFVFCYFELECGFCSHICFIVAMNADMAGNLAEIDYFAFYQQLDGNYIIYLK